MPTRKSEPRPPWRPPPSAIEKQWVNRLQKAMDFATGKCSRADLDELIELVVGGSLGVRVAPSEEQWKDFREKLETGFQAIAKGEQWTLDAPALKVRVTKDGLRYASGDAVGMGLRWRAVELILSREYWRVSRCARYPKCDLLFVRTGRSEYCSSRCASAVRSNKYYLGKALQKTGVSKKQIAAARRKLDDLLKRGSERKS